MLVNSKNLRWMPENKAFIANITDLANVAPWEEIHPNSSTLGIRVLSEKTGKEAKFYIDREVFCPEDELGLQYWLLKPTADSICDIPTLEGVTLLIFND